MTFADIKTQLKALGYDKPLSGKGITKEYLLNELTTLQQTTSIMADTVEQEQETTTVEQENTVDIEQEQESTAITATLQPAYNLAINPSVIGRLEELKRRNALFSVAMTKGKEPKVKSVPFMTAISMYTEDTLSRCKPYNQTFSIKDGENTVKEKYRVKIYDLSRAMLQLKMIPDNQALDISYVEMIKDVEREVWNVKSYSDVNFKNEVETPYTTKAWQTVAQNALKHSINLPMLQLHREGLVSDFIIAAVTTAYVEQKTKALFIKYVENEVTGKKEAVKIPTDKSTIKFIARLLFDQMNYDSDASMLPMKQYLESFININWSLIREHCDIGDYPVDSKETPKQIQSAALFS